MKQQVLQAIRDAFHPDNIDDRLLQERGERVFGFVTVIGSPTFDELDDIRRQSLFWDHLRALLGAGATAVGPVTLEPTTREHRKNN